MECHSVCGSCDQLGDKFAYRTVSFGGCEDRQDMSKCCTCKASAPPIPTLLPSKARETCDGPLCRMELSCTAGHALSQTRSICVRGAPCSALGAGYTESEVEVDSWCGSGYWDTLTRKECATCLPAGEAPVAATTVAPQATTTMKDSRDWELVGGPWNRVCRGNDATDDSPAYYDLHHGVGSLDACKAKCLEGGPARCKGVEYHLGYQRCEVWHREAGIFAFAEPSEPGFTCLRFGWPAVHLKPVGGLGHACRGESPEDNSPDYYVFEQVMHMEDCRARCVRSTICLGIEFSPLYGRCEIWKRPIRAVKAKEGFECLRYEPPALVAAMSNAPAFYP